MADSSSGLIAKVAALLFFVAAGAGVFALYTHGDLEKAEARLANVTQERDKLKAELLGTEKTVLASSSELQICTRELKAAKSAQSAPAAPAKEKAL